MVNSTNLGLDNSKRIVGEEPKKKDGIVATENPFRNHYLKAQELILRAVRKTQQ